MRVLITGGTGLIGRAVAAELAAAGHKVVVLTRNPGRAGKLPPGARAARWDGTTGAGWGDLVDGDSAIVHLAGEGIADGRWSDARKRAIRDSRVRSGEAVTAAIREAKEKPRILLQGSAVGYYGPRGPERITEAEPPGSDFLARVCVDWEASTATVEGMGVRRVVLRTGIVLAKDGGALPKMALPFKMMIGGPLGSGRQGFPWIHLADEVGAIRFLLENDAAQGPFNLTAPEPVSNQELGKAMGRALHRPSLLPTPAFALKI
ncbi:MAG TPA: TIGR01777 family oxidoreductase, partial [Thermoanaerobaculia bacterium]|nr:TIGR01777 family oxidoreductase [Thermoanaerobaculia bacterium]